MIFNRSKLLGMVLLATCAGASADNCDGPVTLISQLQGQGNASAMAGEVVSVQALVSAVMPGLGGYYLLEEQSDWDDHQGSSEGVFVADDQHQPKVGDILHLKATVAEVKTLTQLQQISAYQRCSSGYQVVPVNLTLPLATTMEAYEGMLVRWPQSLTIAENYSFARYGQLLLSHGRLFQPTNQAKAGPGADAIATSNRLNQIIVDDGLSVRDPPLNIDVDHPYRVGNQIADVQGVVHYHFGQYMIEPTTALSVTTTNTRQAQPMVKTKGDIRIASFNVLNYFNGQGDKKVFASKRGARSAQAFKRQSDKIVAAMTVIGADVFGLMEVENDGSGQHAAIVELAGHLARVSGQDYRVVQPPGDKLGDDLIAVGFIYNASTIALVGDAATTSTAPFNVKSRQPLAQTFKATAGGATFTVVVNHFKSKGSCPEDKSDPNANQGDGQACWNLSRTRAASQLLSWLKRHPTGRQDNDVLIIGDLNAYAKEDPILTIEQGGFSNLIEHYQGKQAYSYVYRGLSGYLDHALASASMAAQVVDAVEWHINADEMPLTGYELKSKTPAQQKLLYRADAFRSSDHDPVIVELKLK